MLLCNLYSSKNMNLPNHLLRILTWLDQICVGDASLLQNKNSEFCAPLTSFDWNETDPKRLGTSSIDTTCTIWDIEVSLLRAFQAIFSASYLCNSSFAIYYIYGEVCTTQSHQHCFTQTMMSSLLHTSEILSSCCSLQVNVLFVHSVTNHILRKNSSTTKRSDIFTARHCGHSAHCS